MSGGHWDYNHDIIEDELFKVAQDFEVIRRFPKLGSVLASLAVSLSEIVKEIDWDISGDASIDDDKRFQDESIKKLEKVVGVAKIEGDYKSRVNRVIKELDSIVDKIKKNDL